MKTTVLLFAGVRQAIGTDRVEVEVSDRATIGQLRSALAERYPEAGQLIESALFAIDTQYAADDTTVAASAEIACIPPVSGG